MRCGTVQDGDRDHTGVVGYDHSVCMYQIPIQCLLYEYCKHLGEFVNFEPVYSTVRRTVLVEISERYRFSRIVHY
jgi:hypothetical protein